MKISSPPPAEFHPVSITITFESEEELGAFYSLFNHDRLVRMMPFDCYDIRKALSGTSEQSGNSSPKYGKFHDKLCKIIIPL